MIHIETKRLILREFLEYDVQDLFKLDSNPEVHKYLGNNPVKSIAVCENYIQNCMMQYKTNGISRLALIEKETNAFVGWSGLRFYEKETFNNQSQFYDVGYRLLPEFWGKGYATESGIASVRYGFGNLNLKSIYGITELGNIASHKSLLKIGLDHIKNFHCKKENLALRWYRINKTE